MNYALKLDNVCKTYETSDFLLDNVSFEVPMGSVMGFVGENGAGKTTTLQTITGMLQAKKRCQIIRAADAPAGPASFHSVSDQCENIALHTSAACRC